MRSGYAGVMDLWRQAAATGTGIERGWWQCKTLQLAQHRAAHHSLQCLR